MFPPKDGPGSGGDYWNFTEGWQRKGVQRRELDATDLKQRNETILKRWQSMKGSKNQRNEVLAAEFGISPRMIDKIVNKFSLNEKCK